MADVEEMIKDYWPYALGGAIGIFLIVRFFGSGSSGSSDLAAFYQSQAAASAASVQAAAQNQALQLQANAQAAEIQLKRDTLEAQTQIANMQAQAQMASAVGSSAAQLVGALYTPTIAALNSAGAENAAALQAAAYIASSGFNSQAQMVQAIAATSQSMADAIQVWGPLSQGVALGMHAKSTGQSLIGGGVELGKTALLGF